MLLFLRRRRQCLAWLLLCTGLAGAATLHAAGAQGRISSSADAAALFSVGGLKFNYDPLTKTGYLEKDGVFGSFAVNEPYLVWNWKESVRVPAPVDSAQGLFFAPEFIAAVRSRFETIQKAAAQHYRIAAILIDPGHGGKDSGAIGDFSSFKVMEKTITLAVARRVTELLRQRYSDRTIMITRTGDTYPSLEERVEMANATKLGQRETIIYVSIHANASFNKDARGYEVWYLNPDYRRTLVDAGTVKDKGTAIAPILNAMLEEEFTTESIILARKVMDRLGSAIGRESPSRGVRAEEWFVVRNAKMPSILIEMGFVTNSDEAALLNDEAYLRRIGDAIYNGIADFVQHFEE